MNNLLTVDDLAAHFQVTPRTIQRWTRDLALPCFKIGLTGRVFYRPEEVDQWLERQRLNPPTEQTVGRTLRMAK